MEQGEPLLPDATRKWVERVARPVRSATRLRGGWSSEMRLLEVDGPDGPERLVLRFFTKPHFLRHAEAMLQREAATLDRLAGTGIPVARTIAIDACADECAFPSLLRTCLPGAIQLQDDGGAATRCDLLARLLVTIHRVEVDDATRPRAYQAWTRHDLVRVPPNTQRPELWARAIHIIRADPPAYDACFLHRDFHPGNVLFDAQQQVSGVVDWVETSWGPADLDVSHCSTSLALLHGVTCGIEFAERYRAAGGHLASDPAARSYWYLLDALAFAPDAEKVAVAWREAGRPDLTPDVVSARLEDYLFAVVTGAYVV
jgi:aminoglycoside phosphotransferase (APT) family kinase protein